MKTAHTIRDARETIRQAKLAGKTVALVPTMGALHAGHLSLIDAAGAACDFTAVSIFVNPTQFAPDEDFAQYPRTLAADLAACDARGVDLVFAPDAGQMHHTDPPATTAIVAPLARTLCGPRRPGHFAGVCGVVARLFNIVQPDKAFFGAKDFQQAAIIRRMTAELAWPIEIVVCPTIREADGLAMSSRNANLAPAHRRQAATLYESLQMAARTIRRKHPAADRVIAEIRQHLAAGAPDGEIDYVQIVDPASLQDTPSTNAAVLIALAVKFGDTRLIDNIATGRTP